jgi:PAS domain S-box-containing protein
MNPKTPYQLIEQIDRLPWVRTFFIGSIYILSSWAGRVDANVQGNISLMWPPAGIAVAAALIFGLRVWPAVACGAFVVTVSTGAPLGFAVAAALGSVVEIVIVVKVMERVSAIDQGLARVRDIFSFFGIAVVLAPIAGATIDTLGVCLFAMAPWPDFVGLWRLDYIGDAMGILVVAPALLTWCQRPEERMTRPRLLEAILLILLLIVVSQTVYGGLLDERMTRPLSLACFPFIVWGALRFGQRGTATAAVVAVSIAVLNTVHGHGPFVYLRPSLNLAFLYGLMGAVTVIGLLLGAVVTEYRTVARELSEAREYLEARVADRTNALEEQLRERERVSAALRDSEERYRRITQTITDYIYVVSFIDGHAVRTTHAPACTAVTGYSSEEFDANPFLWFHMVYPDDRARVLGLTTAIMSSRKSVSIEHRIVRKDGVVRWIRNTTVPIFNFDGVLTSYDGLIQDITDRKLAEEAVRESESKFRAVFDSAGIGIAISSLDGLIQRCNPALERMLGYGPGDLNGQPSKRISHPAEHLRLKEDARRIMVGTDPEHGLTVDRRLIRKDGSTLWVRLTTTILRDAEGNPQSGLGIVEDITVQKATEQERENLLRQVREAMANVRTLSGLVPICSSCKKIRDERGGWKPVEEYITAHTGAEFTHGICPDCLTAFYPEYVNGYADLLASAARRHATEGLQDQGSIEG